MSQLLMVSSARLGSKIQSKTLYSKVFCSLLGNVKTRCHAAAVTDSSICCQTIPAQLDRFTETVLLSLLIHPTETVLLSLLIPPATSTPSNAHGDCVAAKSMSWQYEQTADAMPAERSLSLLTQRFSPRSRSHRDPSKKETRSRLSLADTLADYCGAPCRSRQREQF